MTDILSELQKDLVENGIESMKDQLQRKQSALRNKNFLLKYLNTQVSETEKAIRTDTDDIKALKAKLELLTREDK